MSSRTKRHTTEFALSNQTKSFVLTGIGEIMAPDTPEAWLSLVGLIATKMLNVMPTEQDHWWFLMEQFDRSMQFATNARAIVISSPISLHEIEYVGRRSENSYVGAPNPAVTFLQKVQCDLNNHYSSELSEVVIANTYVSYVRACFDVLNRLRIKYAVHFHNNCISSHSYRHADRWNEVIKSLGGD